MVDERYTITEQEKENIIRNYIVNDKIIKIPRAEKKNHYSSVFIKKVSEK